MHPPRPSCRSWKLASFAAALTLACPPAMAQAPGPACPVPGEVVQWIADYCMLTLQTDDEIAVSDCIAENLKKPFAGECAAKTHFKRAMCGLSPQESGPAGSVERCVADPDFMGRTVSNNGVGG